MSKNGNGIGFSGLLTVVFIVLKLTGVISWKWLWVVSPIWISVCIAVVVCLITLICSIFFD